jgi:hypothetical protein
VGPQPEIGGLADLDPDEVVVRKVRWIDMYTDPATLRVTLNPIPTFKFDPDLSLHRQSVVKAEGSTVETEYGIPPEGAVAVAIPPLLALGARAKQTPIPQEGILGLAHASIYGVVNPIPNKMEKARFRDNIVKNMRWLGEPIRPL